MEEKKTGNLRKSSNLGLDLSLPNLKARKASIIMASYNHPEFLAEAIKSIEDQTLGDWELIIVDDASIDPQNAKVMNSAKLREPDCIKILKNEENQNNIAYSWNRALDVANGKYIAFLDSDNRKGPKFLEKMVAHLDSHPKTSVVACFNQIMDGRGKLLPHIHRDALQGLDSEAILKQNRIDSGELLVRRSVLNRLGYFDERCILAEDWDMIVNLVKFGKVDLIPEPLAYYRIHNDNRMKWGAKTPELERTCIQLIREKERNKDLWVYLIIPDRERLTESQYQVCRGISDGLKEISWVDLEETEVSGFDSDVAAESELVIVAAPFMISVTEMATIASYETPILTSHMEDPSALGMNLQRTQFATWVITNDQATVKGYRDQQLRKFPEDQKQASKVFLAPSLSINTTRLPKRKYSPSSVKYDMIICGFAYQSRIEFLESIAPLVDFKLLLIGDGWAETKLPFKTRRTLPEEETFPFYQVAKIITCLHRIKTDCGGSNDGISPMSLTRGFIEAYSGAMVMIDERRDALSSFMPNEIVIFDHNNPQDFIDKAHFYLGNEKERLRIARRGERRARLQFSFKDRWTKILNAVRSERYGLKVA